MSARSYFITANNKQLRQLISKFSAKDLTFVQGAIRKVADAIANRWRHEIHSVSGRYANSVYVSMDPGNPLDAIVYTTAPYAPALEWGAPPLDMKTYINTSRKSKTYKDGSGKYLIIPIRWDSEFKSGTVTAPKRIQEMAKSLAPNTRQSLAHQPAYMSHYHGWNFNPRTGKATYPQHWLFTPWSGMRHQQGYLQARRGKYRRPFLRKASGGKDFYMTFRTMSTRSDADSWIFPGITPRHFVRRTANWGESQLKSAIREATNKEIQWFTKRGMWRP